MFKLIKRWLGWDSDSGMFDFNGIEPPRRPRSATASVLTHGPREKTKKTPSVEPGSFTLERDAETREPAFDPYNTGKFDRSASWERISRTQR